MASFMLIAVSCQQQIPTIENVIINDLRMYYATFSDAVASDSKDSDALYRKLPSDVRSRVSHISCHDNCMVFEYRTPVLEDCTALVYTKGGIAIYERESKLPVLRHRYLQDGWFIVDHP